MGVGGKTAAGVHRGRGVRCGRTPFEGRAGGFVENKAGGGAGALPGARSCFPSRRGEDSRPGAPLCLSPAGAASPRAHLVLEDRKASLIRP